MFWAIRGGGGVYGIVTALQLALFPAAEVYGGQLLWPFEQMPEVLRAYRTVTGNSPDALTVWFHAYQFPPLPELPEPLRGKSFAAVAVAYLARPQTASGCWLRFARCPESAST